MTAKNFLNMMIMMTTKKEKDDNNKDHVIDFGKPAVLLALLYSGWRRRLRKKF